MKKVAFILVAICFIALCGCKKEKDCKCVVKITGVGSQYADDTSYTLTIKEGDCSDLNNSATTGGTTATTTCSEQ